MQSNPSACARDFVVRTLVEAFSRFVFIQLTFIDIWRYNARGISHSNSNSINHPTVITPDFRPPGDVRRQRRARVCLTSGQTLPTMLSCATNSWRQRTLTAYQRPRGMPLPPLRIYLIKMSPKLTDADVNPMTCARAQNGMRNVGEWQVYTNT